MNFLGRISKNIQMSKFHENPSSEGRVVSRGQTDRYDESNSHFSKFCGI